MADVGVHQTGNARIDAPSTLKVSRAVSVVVSFPKVHAPDYIMILASLPIFIHAAIKTDTLIHAWAGNHLRTSIKDLCVIPLELIN